MKFDVYLTDLSEDKVNAMLGKFPKHLGWSGEDIAQQKSVVPDIWSLGTIEGHGDPTCARHIEWGTRGYTYKTRVDGGMIVANQTSKLVKHLLDINRISYERFTGVEIGDGVRGVDEVDMDFVFPDLPSESVTYNESRANVA